MLCDTETFQLGKHTAHRLTLHFLSCNTDQHMVIRDKDTLRHTRADYSLLLEIGKKEPDGRRWLIGAKELTDCIRERSKAAKEREKKRMAAEKAKVTKNAPVRKLPSKPAAKPARKRGLK